MAQVPLAWCSRRQRRRWLLLCQRSRPRWLFERRRIEAFRWCVNALSDARSFLRRPCSLGARMRTGWTCESDQPGANRSLRPAFPAPCLPACGRRAGYRQPWSVQSPRPIRRQSRASVPICRGGPKPACVWGRWRVSIQPAARLHRHDGRQSASHRSVSPPRPPGRSGQRRRPATARIGRWCRRFPLTVLRTQLTPPTRDAGSKTPRLFARLGLGPSIKPFAR